jgi:RimJ/RimL family protein N-acetyltransferase
MFPLTTERLNLLPLTLDSLRKLVLDRAEMERELGLHPSRMQISDEIMKELEEALPVWISQVESHQDLYHWYTNWEVVLRSENRSIGSFGLSGFPDQNGELYVGYVVDGKYHNLGFMTEALNGLLGWVYSEPAVVYVLAETPKDNLPSQKVLQKQGFRIRKETDHTFIWELHRSDFIASFWKQKG